MALPGRRLAFCREYVANGGNATQAYLKAGYSKKGASQGAERLLRNVEIANEIAARQARKQEAADVTVAEVLGLLRQQAEAGGTKATELLGRYIGMWDEKQDTADSWNALTIELSTRGPTGEA